MQSRLSSPKSDRVSVSVDAIACILPKVRSPILCQWMRSRISSPKCDRVYLPQTALACILPKVRSLFCIVDAIASLFPNVRSRFRIMYAIASIFTQSAIAYSVSVDAIAHPKQMGSVYSTHQIVNPDICTNTDNLYFVNLFDWTNALGNPTLLPLTSPSPLALLEPQTQACVLFPG